MSVAGDSFVMVSGYGDGAAGYLPMAAHWEEGYDDSYCWVTPDSAREMMGALGRVLRKEELPQRR